MKVTITKPCYSATIDPEYSSKDRRAGFSPPYEETITVSAFAADDMAHKAVRVQGNSHDVEMSLETAAETIKALTEAIAAVRSAQGGAA